MNVLFDENNLEHKAREMEAVMSDWWGDVPKLELKDRLHWGIQKVGITSKAVELLAVVVGTALGK